MSSPTVCTSCMKPYANRSGAEPCPRCGAIPVHTHSVGIDPAGARLAFSEEQAKKAEALAAKIMAAELTRQTPSSPMPVAAGLVGIEEAERECPRCAERIKARARVCRFCGHDFEAERLELERDEPQPLGRNRRGRVTVERVDGPREIHHHYHGASVTPGVAVVLSFFFVGLGQLYCGRVGRGIAWIVCGPMLVCLVMMATVPVAVFVEGGGHSAAHSPVSFAFAYLLGLGVWIANLVDAFMCASDDIGEGPRTRRY